MEHDYLGGMGSRGSGKVAFQNISISLRNRNDYFTQATEIGTFETMSDLLGDKNGMRDKIIASLGL